MIITELNIPGSYGKPQSKNTRTLLIYLKCTLAMEPEIAYLANPDQGAH